MAKKADTKRVVGIRPTSLAVFEGTFAAIIGLTVAILHSLDSAVKVADATDSVLRGLAFGMASGIVSMVVVPLIYFGIGWLIGLFHGWVFNIVLGASGGLVLDVEDEQK